MRRWTLPLLACPSCRCGFTLCAVEQDGDEVSEGHLSCPDCHIEVPIRRGFAMFTLAGIGGEPSGDVFGTPETYALYRRRKAERGELEPYAAFQPFNESTRAVEPLLARFEAHLRPGDVILDPWSRTGWSAAWLAARFPDQKVVALWEGDRSVLGHAGFAAWFEGDKRPLNLEILFVHPERGLPFGDNVFAALYAHDCWHRFSPLGLWSECLRVTQSTAPLVIAHTHLSNSEPDPWFDRGGTIRSGEAYRHWLDALLEGDARRGWILSELDLFGATDVVLPADSPAIEHYNALIFVADPAIEPVRRSASTATHFLVNPLYRIDWARRSASIDPRLYDGIVGELLVRHPGYVAALPKGPVALCDRDLLTLAFAVTGCSAAEARATLGAPVSAALFDADLLLATPVTGVALEMQRFHALQLPPPGAIDAFLGHLGDNGAQLRASDGSIIGGAELTELVGLIAAVLDERGVGQRRSLSCLAIDHPLGLATIFAAVGLGADVWLDAPPSEGLPHLMIGGDLRDPISTGDLRLGLDGAPGGLLASVHAAAPLTRPLRPAGDIVAATGDSPLRVESRTVIEAALSLSSASRRGDVSLARVNGPADLLSCFATLAAGGTVHLG